MKSNVKFDELAKQCYVKTGSIHSDHFDYVKFAELIVRECADVAADVVCKAEGVEFGLVAACYRHFGVEQ